MSVIGMPIRARGALIGVFGIGAWPPRILDADDEALLDLFARHAAMAIDNAHAELRGLLHELAPGDSKECAAPPTPARDALPEALQRLLRTMVPAQVHLHFDVSGFRPKAATHEEAMLRVCQEAVSNATRHASPGRIEIEVALSASQLHVVVSDDGRGMPKNTGGGMGLNNMRDRLREIGRRSADFVQVAERHSHRSAPAAQ